MIPPCFFHVDLDAFFASVEQLDNPEYRGKPVIVGALPTDRRGVVSTCSYEARLYGVHSAMPIGRAFQLCPSGVFLRGRMKRYHEKSREVMTVLNEFSPDVQQMSVDEAFMDMSGTERLFGPAEEAAKKLKETVHKRTGLTLSIGAAANKYIAKIASGMSKPDGLYIVENGKEENFMLSLPLQKIWGVGGKTLERITQAGFNTSRDIHKASLNLLQSLFGSCTGSFLYRAVRGCEVETFDSETKNRSISSEHTFSFDLTDLYTIDTALLELSWELMYRLLTEGWNSKTVCVKIRYEDFTTVSIQETSERILSSADDLYDRAKTLFRKKYENGRGIRLLGLGAQNLESSNTPVQSELFDFGEKKKAAVEKAVIGIQKKNPAVRVEKARLLHAKEELQPNKTPAQNVKPLQTLLLFFLTAAFLLFGDFRLFSQESSGTEAVEQGLNKPLQTTPLFPNGASALFSSTQSAFFPFVPDSPEIEFYARGSWEAKLQSTFGIESSGNKAPVFSLTPPVFIQKTDLTVWFFLKKKWYFEAAVADNYEKSTVAAGYYGDNILRRVRVGNRGIDFPVNYGIDTIGRGAGAASDQAPGINAHWQDSTWQADALIRYDMLESFEKKWAGFNELSEQRIGLHEWQQGLRFTLPKGTAAFIASVYIESDKGSYKDTQHYTYTKLTPSDYLILNASDTLLLAKPASGRILVDFHSDDGGYSQEEQIKNKLGNFSTAGSTGSFLKDIQDWFSPTSLELQNYSYPALNGSVEDGFFTNLENPNGQNAHALIIQYPPYFSPFADASLYALSSGLKASQTNVVSASGIEQSSYGTLTAEENSYGGIFGGTDFFGTQVQYIRLFNRNAHNAALTSASQTAERYPAAKDTPFIYLTPQAQTAGTGGEKPAFISVQTVSTGRELDIGTEAVPGSVVMYRNGIKETGFRYDSKTGIVHPINPPLAFDNIRIVWQQHKEGAQTGRLSAAAGIQKRLGSELDFDVSASLLWPLTKKNSFSLTSSAAVGSLNTAAQIQWQKKDFSLANTSALSFEVPDTTGVRRILGMDSSKPKQILLTEKADAGFPDGIIPVLKKRPSSPGSFTSLGTNTGTISAETLRPQDKDGYAVRINWRIQTNEWVARTIDFKGAATSLASAQEFGIWLKTDSPNPPPTYEIYLQLGVKENQETDSGEPLPTWKITDNTGTASDIKNRFDPATTGTWQKVTVYLRDEDRLQLARSQNARLIIRSTSSASGTLWAGPAEIGGTSFTLDVPGGCLLRSAEVQSPPAADTADMLRFNQNGINSVQFFEWDIPGNSGKTVRAYRYTEALPLASYDTLNFFIYIAKTENTVSDITFKKESSEEKKTALALTIEKEGMEKIKDASSDDGWQKAVFDLHSRKLSVNGIELTGSEVRVSECNTTVAPNRIEFAFYAKEKNTPAEGNMYIDEIHLTGKDYRLNFENILAFDWRKSGTVLSVKGFPLAANPQFTAKLRAGVQSGNLTHINSQAGMGMYSDGRIGAEIAGTETSVSAAFSVSNQHKNIYNLKNASHRIRTTPVFFITRLFSASEEYSFTPLSYSANKTETFSFDLSPVNVPLSVSFKTDAQLYPQSLKQTAVLEGRYSSKKEKTGWNTEARVDVLQYGQRSRPMHTDYFAYWLDASELQFSDGKSHADKRDIGFTLNQNLSFFEKSFEAQICLNARNSYGNHTKTENTASDSIGFRFPFTVKQQQFSLEWTKKSSSAFERTRGGSYTQDAFVFGQSMNKRSWAYTALPVYDFFDTDLCRKMQKSGIPLSVYESLWEFSWKRPLFVSPIDIIVPSHCSFSASRSVRVSPADTSDTVQFKTSLNFTAFNSFGRFGSMRLCSWYDQDETVSSLTFIYKTDRSNRRNYRFGLSGYSQFMLFFTEKDTLRFYIEYRLDTDSTRNIKFETVWDRAGKTSIVKDAFAFLFPKLSANAQNKKNIQRKNGLTAAISSAPAHSRRLSQTYGLNHSVEFDIGDRTKASVFSTAELFIANKSFSLKNTAGVSAKIQF